MIKINKTVRLLSVELNGFKNICHGFFQMPLAQKGKYSKESAEILGIYGQNGSGKTAVLEALRFLRDIFLNQSFPTDTANYICNTCEKTELSFSFYIHSEDKNMLFTIQ